MENFEANKANIIDEKLKELFNASRAGQVFNETDFAKKLTLRIENQKSKSSFLLNFAQIAFVTLLIAAFYLLPKSIGNIQSLFLELNSFFDANEKAAYMAIILFGAVFMKFANGRNSII